MDMFVRYAIRSAILGCALLLVPGLRADDVVLVEGQSINKTGWNDGQYWDPEIAPNTDDAAGYDYWIYSKNSMRTSASASYCLYKCNSFHIGRLSESSAGYIADCKTGGVQTNEFANEGLYLEMGGYSVNPSRYCDVTVIGRITVLSPDGNNRFSVAAGPVKEDGTPSILRLGGKLVGASTVGFKTSSLAKGARVVMQGDASEYYGKLYANTVQGWLSFGDIVFNGDVTHWHGRIGVESAGDAPQLKSLRMTTEAGELFVPVSGTECGTITVTNSFTQTYPMTVVLGDLPTPTTATTENIDLPLIRLAPGCSGTLDSSLFTYGGVEGSTNGLPSSASISVVAGGDGSQTLLLSVTPVVRLVKGDSGLNSDGNGGETSAITNATSWSDGALPHGGADYIVGDESTMRLRTEYTTSASIFEGSSLTLAKYADFMQMTKFLTVEDLRIYPGAKYTLNYMWQLRNENALRGALETHSYSESDFIRFNVYFYQNFALDSALSGNGNLHFYASGGSAHPHGYVTLTNANPSFTGTWYFTIDNASKTVDGVYYANWSPSDLHCQTLRLGCGAALGGALPEFNYKSLHLNQQSVLATLDSLTLDEPTRGVYVNGMARFNTLNGRTLTLLSPFTLHGELRKEGTGTLEMGGELNFIDADGALTDTPTDGSNVLVVAQGSLKTLSKTAYDGLAITFTNASSSLVFDLAPTNADVAAYGFYNVKNETNPFTTTVGAVAVEFPAADDSEMDASYTVALMTLKTSELAEAVRANLAPVRIDHYDQKLSVRTNEDGTATIVDSIRREGFMVIVR